MAFDFLDMFPDSQAAVVGANGAREILENKNKQAMDQLALENALVQSVGTRQKFDQAQAEAPLQKTLNALQVLQKINTGGEQFQGIDLQNPQAIQGGIENVVKSGGLKTDYDVEIEKAQMAAKLQEGQKMMQQQAITGRNNADNSAALFKVKAESADKAAATWLGRGGKFAKAPRPGSKTYAEDLSALQGALKALQPYSDQPNVAAFLSKYSAIGAPAGVSAPMGRAPIEKKAPAAPKTIVIEGRTFQKVNGKIQEVK